MVQEKVQAVLDVLQSDWDEVCRQVVPAEVDGCRLCFARDVKHQLISSLPMIINKLLATSPSNANQVRSPCIRSKANEMDRCFLTHTLYADSFSLCSIWTKV